MSLLKKIKSIVEAMEIEFLYDNGGGLDILIDRSDLHDNKCVAYCFLMSNSTLKDNKESANFGIFFAKMTDFDFDSIENDTLQEECKVIAAKFIDNVLQGNELTINGELSLQYFYDEFSVNVTGVAVNATFEETQGVKIC